MSKKVLVADDSPTVRKAAESLLRKHGYEVLCAEEGASALGMAKTDKPDLILWDASLPVLDGRGACEELKGNDELKDTPVIITLTGEQADKEEELRQLGADAFAVKPFNPKEILEKVQEFLHSESADLPDEMPTEPKEQPAEAEQASGTDKPQESLAPSEEKEKTDESLDIIETSDFLESFKDALSGSDGAEDHGFDWFMDELRKELDEVDQAELGAEPKAKEKAGSTEMTSLPQQDSTKEEEGEKKEEVYQIDQEQKGYEDLLGELKGESEETRVEESSDQRIPSVDYDKMVCDLIEKVSAKIAQEVAKKIDPEALRKTLQDEVEKLRR